MTALWSIGSCVAALIASISNAATPTAGPKQYSASSFFNTTAYQMAGGLAWSVDNRQLLVSSDETGIFNAYSIAPANGEKKPLTRSTSNSTFAVSWFPHDARILFTADEGGNEINHLYVRELSGAVRDLTPEKKAKAEFAGWSADDQSFFVMTNERDAKSFDVYRYATKDYARTKLFHNADAWDVGAISPDGRYVALVKPRSSADSDIYLFDTRTASKAPKLITEHKGDVSHQVFEFSPDSKTLAYATDEFGEYQQAWGYDIETNTKKVLVKAAWDVAFLSFSRSGNFRVWGVNEDARTAVHILDVRSGKEIELPDLPPGDLAQIRFSRDEKQLALMLSSDTSPSDVYTVDLSARRTARLTHALNPEIRENDLVSTEVVRYKSFDGLAIPSILYKPKNASSANRVPALVFVHGGPGGQSRTGYSATIQHLVNHGYAVLAANNRGSSGYGKTFFHADDRKHGEIDLQDIVYAKTYLKSLDWVDPESIGIMGGSYGGYMVGAALAFSPDTFDVGIDIFGVMNWVRTLTSIPPWWEAQKKALYDEMGDPATDAERHRRISPLFHTRNIRVPLLVIQGKNDPRVLQVESDEIVAAVKSNGVPVEYIVFPDEGHGFTKRNNRIKASDAYVAFLDANLKTKK
ncbi:MAG: S9 family peptidase [Povalibacter sp.]